MQCRIANAGPELLFSGRRTRDNHTESRGAAEAKYDFTLYILYICYWFSVHMKQVIIFQILVITKLIGLKFQAVGQGGERVGEGETSQL